MRWRSIFEKEQWPAVLAVAGVLCAGAFPAFAETIQKSFATIANPAFVLHSHNGTVSVAGWDQNQVEIRGERASAEAMDVLIEGNAEKVTIKTHPKQPNLALEEARVDLTIRVPREAVVRVESEQGDIVIENVEGGVTVEGVTTSVTLSEIRGHITARTVDGPIVIRSSEGVVQADSISGDLQFLQVDGVQLTGTTNSGRIQYQGDFGLGGTYKLHSYSSPIEVQASPQASFDVDARSIQGTIDNRISFPQPPRTASSLAAPARRTGRSVQGRVHTGKSTVQITSYSGTIRLSGGR
jgi:DUF4097 and DUF4098 domain-containing protein YvlB